MAWDFSTDPEFQEKLDWVEQFCKEKVEPLDYVLPYAIRTPDPVIRAYVRELQQEVKDQGLWAIFLDEELGGPGFGQLKLGLLNEIIGRYGSAPQLFGAAAPDTGNMEMLAAYGTEEQKEAVARAVAQPGDVLGVLDDRAPGWVRSEPVQDARRP
jgi:acyl-CoA dehydrogenase